MHMARKHNHDDDDESSSKKRVKISDNGDVASWYDLEHNLLFIVMMQLGVVDFLSFRGVCKSWRSFAVSNRNKFMASKPPMSMRVRWRTSKKICHLEDSEGRKFKTILPHFTGGACVGLTRGYLIFFRWATRDFCLVNPITRHQHYFPDFPNDNFSYPSTYDLRAILVFSLSVSQWVFVVLHKCYRDIWFSIAGEEEWNHVLHTSYFVDVCAFKGKIYTLTANPSFNVSKEIWELRLNLEPELKLLQTKNSLTPYSHQELVSSGENLYVVDNHLEDGYRFQELDFIEKKWVSREKKMGEYETFLSDFKHGVAFSPEFDSRGQGLLVGLKAGEMLRRIDVERDYSFVANMWYFPHECLKVDRMDE